ncbi:uncharacterized protein LOC126311202 [Schistocerca gregaria]|uniref:uncharacterized protein LOC126311202 n=1 Tax=Schistocerca gregaria TaxID=7010 RepID=UPI00211DB1B3|nr:uncharacterized protein LOC126311202 [Schistocerca gregaria]
MDVFEVNLLADERSPFHERWLFWRNIHRGVRGNKLRQNGSAHVPQKPMMIDDVSRDAMKDNWNEWLGYAEVFEDCVDRRQLSRSLFKRASDISIDAEKNCDAILMGLDEDDRACVQDNIATLRVAIEEVSDTYNSNGRHIEHQEGRILAIMDNDGIIADWNYHLLPHTVNPGTTKPDIFCEKVFESWWKSQEIWQEMVRANKQTESFASIFAPIPKNKPLKNIPGTLEHCGVSSEHSSSCAMLEFVILLDDDGEFYWCMVAFYDDIALGCSMSERQKHILLLTLNEINRSGVAIKKKLENNIKFQPYVSLEKYRISRVLVTPLLFQFLKWAKEQKKISMGRFMRKLKFSLNTASPYLQVLHENAMSPLNLGLRALLLPSSSLI